jgi:hypothetical protein
MRRTAESRGRAEPQVLHDPQNWPFATDARWKAARQRGAALVPEPSN